MSEMIERVARALALADLDEETAMAVDLDAHMKFVSEHYEELARAAIEAMREPGLAIRKITTFEFAEVEWPRLIDAAIRSGEQQ